MHQPPSQCELCKRESHLTRHHLIPRTVHNRRRIHRAFTREEMQGAILWVCRGCHSMIHNTFGEMELALHFNSREQLLTHEEIRKFVKWVAKRPAGFKPKGRIRRR